jgi:hypothetical protein
MVEVEFVALLSRDGLALHFGQAKVGFAQGSERLFARLPTWVVDTDWVSDEAPLVHEEFSPDRPLNACSPRQIGISRAAFELLEPVGRLRAEIDFAIVERGCFLRGGFARKQKEGGAETEEAKCGGHDERG